MGRASLPVAFAAVLPLISGCRSVAGPPRSTSAPVSVPTPTSIVAPAPVVPSPAVSPGPAAQLVDHLGDSPQTAVAVPALAKDEAIPFENKWIFNRYGRFRRLFSGVGNQEERRYDVVKIELADGTHQTIYFDITESWNAWNPSP